MTSQEFKQEADKWWIIILRHGTTIVIFVGALWWLATPRIELFIKDTVNERIERVEQQLDRVQQQLTELKVELDKVSKEEQK